MATDKTTNDSGSTTVLSSIGVSAEPLPGRKICRERMLKDLVGVDLSYFHFQDVEAKGLKFSKCVFQHCVFERCYFREAVFENCNFTGSRFIDCNLRNATLITCKIEYTLYRGTILERKQFGANLPLWENVRAGVARSLRTNAQGLGDAEGVNFFINRELDGTLEHWWKAVRQQESYYRQKYGGFRRFEALVRFAYCWLGRIAWGDGESPLCILRNIFLLLCLFSVWLIVAKVSHNPAIGVGELFPTSIESFFTSLRVFLGAALPAGAQIPPGFDLALVGLRYVAVALFVGVLAKRWTRR